MCPYDFGVCRISTHHSIGHVCLFWHVIAVVWETGHFHFFSNFLNQDWAPGPIRMCRDRRDIAGRVLKVRFGRVFFEKVYFSFKFGSPSATYPFLGPLLLGDCSRNASTRFGACFSFRTRSSNLLSHSLSLPHHAFFKTG